MRFEIPPVAFSILVLATASLAVLEPTSLTPIITAQTPQNSIQLFAPVDVRRSAAGTGYGLSAVNFNSTTLNLNCAVAPITAVVSSTPDGTGYMLVDNNLNLTVTSGSKITGPINACVGGINTSVIGPFPNCFNTSYENEANSGTLPSLDPDVFVASGGVPPFDIGKYLAPGPIQLKIDLQDEGGYLANSTLYLNTNCTQGGVTGPALISGNPISSTNPTSDELSQNFSFSSTFAQQIGFQYDLTAAQAARTLSITDQTIPEVGDQPLDPLVFKSVFTPGTSFATSSCLVHAGELLPTGAPACKLYTLDCKVGTGSTATGAECPISTLPNEIFEDEFDGPGFTLPDIATPNGPTFHQGIGLLMAKEGWTGGPCTFDAAANLNSLDCPQNLLSSFNSTVVSIASVRKSQTNVAEASAQKPAANSPSRVLELRPEASTSSSSGSSYTSTGRTTHPNSTFISIAGVPEDLTTVSVAGQQPGYWINKPTAVVTLSSQPPNLSGANLPGAATFVPSPIQSITYGLATSNTLPAPGDVLTSDTRLVNSQSCPTPSYANAQPASAFNPGEQTLSNLKDGYYLVYYFAQDCAGTEELKYTQDAGGFWSTSFYTYPLNVDTAAPAIASGPTLSPAPAAQGAYTLGQSVSASFSCTDALSGIVKCGTQSYAVPTPNTGTLTISVDTLSPGSKTFSAAAIDAAGNPTTRSVSYQVSGSYDTLIKVTPQSSTISYPGSTLVGVTISPSAASLGHTPKGIVVLEDGSNAFAALGTLPVQGNGTGNGVASFYISSLSAGTHNLVAKYSGDTYNPAGLSTPSALTVQPAPVRLTVSCTNGILVAGANYTCKVYTTPILAGSNTAITYLYDNGNAVSVPLSSGAATFTIPTPSVGQHSVVLSYAAQDNYAAAAPQTQSFIVVPR